MKTIAVVGLSATAGRPSYNVAAYLQAHGYRIIPVNPGQTEILGEKAYPDLKNIPGAVDVVDVFRRPEHVAAVVDETLAIGARALWLQDGVIDETAAKKAEDAGLLVVMDDCMLRRHKAHSDPDYAPACEI
ncbi:MAG: CoA-binding protein [Candidatus Neomarinimicrobiota bacterium]